LSGVCTAEIIGNDEIAPGIFKLRLRLPAGYQRPEPGQFVNLYLNDPSRLLPRPISVCGWHESVLTLVYAVVGAGTRAISGYGIGAKIRVSTPLGNGFAVQPVKSCILVGGGVGVPPLLYLANRLAENGRDALAVLGFRGEPFLTDEFPCAVEVATDDGSAGFKGNVVELLEKLNLPASGTQILACGPKPMLGALAKFAAKRGIALQVSLEERMGCGYGACVGCVCKTAGGSRKVCEDGPVFAGDEVIWDE